MLMPKPTAVRKPFRYVAVDSRLQIWEVVISAKRCLQRAHIEMKAFVHSSNASDSHEGMSCVDVDVPFIATVFFREEVAKRRVQRVDGCIWRVPARRAPIFDTIRSTSLEDEVRSCAWLRSCCKALIERGSRTAMICAMTERNRSRAEFSPAKRRARIPE